VYKKKKGLKLKPFETRGSMAAETLSTENFAQKPGKIVLFQKTNRKGF